MPFMKFIFPASFLFLTSLALNAQKSIEPIIGYAIDINNGKYPLRQFNTGVQLAWGDVRKDQLLLTAQVSIPHTYKSSDSSFTLNPALPLYQQADKKIKPFSASVSIGYRIKLFEVKTVNKFSLLLYTGLTYQHIVVNYSHDKENYIILNPEKSIKSLGIFGGGGLEYMRLLKKGNVFFQVKIDSPPLTTIKNRLPSLRLLVPLSLNVGYSFPLNKRSNEKKQ